MVVDSGHIVAWSDGMKMKFGPLGGVGRSPSSSVRASSVSSWAPEQSSYRHDPAPRRNAGSPTVEEPEARSSTLTGFIRPLGKDARTLRRASQ